jgi:hypothetical protein
VFCSPRSFIALLLIEVCVLYLLRLPLLYNFNSFAFWDSGAFLVAHYLLQQGHQPFIYFGWQYGLLPLFIQELGFRVLGASPASFLLLSAPCALTVAVVMGRFALLEGAIAGRILLILTLPMVLAFELDMPHSLEPALLSLGLLSQAKAKYGRALGFATAACFTKPSMGYLYGLVLLLLIFCGYDALTTTDRNSAAADPNQSRRSQLSRTALTMVYALATGLGLSLLLSISFGWSAVFHSLLPSGGMRAYQALHYGWRQIGHGLFYFPGVKPAYYIGTPVSFWACATVYLIIAAFCILWSTVRGHLRKLKTHEIVLTCAVLHISFIVLMYGSPSSWTYYAFVLVVGTIATASWPRTGAVLGTLCVLAAASNYGAFKTSISAWKSMRIDSSTAGLFAAAPERSEWMDVASLVSHDKAALFSNFGEAQLLFPWLSRPTAALMISGVASRGDIERTEHELRTANLLIIPTTPQPGNALRDWPNSEFSDVLLNMAPVYKGTYFEVYRRRDSPVTDGN